MATNIIIRNIDEGIHKALKKRAIDEDKTLQDLIKELLKKALTDGKKK